MDILSRKQNVANVLKMLEVSNYKPYLREYNYKDVSNKLPYDVTIDNGSWIYEQILNFMIGPYACFYTKKCIVVDYGYSKHVVDHYRIDNLNCPYILMLIYSYYCRTSRFPHIVTIIEGVETNKTLMAHIQDVYKNGQKMTTIEWTVLFFQIIYTNAFVQQNYPDVRFGRLKPHDIFITKENSQKILKLHDFTIFSSPHKFYIPNINLEIRILPTALKTEREIDLKSETLYESQNRYHDIHTFFDKLLLCTSIYTYSDEIVQFLDRIIPPFLRSTTWSRIEPYEYTTPMDILMNDPFFEKFRQKPKQNKLFKTDIIISVDK